MRWWDGLALGCLATVLLVALFAALAIEVHRREPTPVPYSTPRQLT